MPEIEETIPKYLQIAGHIRAQIDSGELPPGAEVPSERELAVTWKVARPTAAKALNTLRQDGIVESRRGAGTRVAKQRPPAWRPERGGVKRYDVTAGEAEGVRFLDTAFIDGPTYVTEALGISEGSAVICRKRITEDESGTELTTSWFPGELAVEAGRLLMRERLGDGTARYIESATGRAPTRAQDQLSARLATADERQHLDLAWPAPVLVSWRTVRDAQGAPIQFDEAVYPPDQWAFQQDYAIEE